MCFSRICCCCACIVLAVIAVGFFLGFGVFRHGFDHLKNSFHVCVGGDTYGNATVFCGRPLLATAPSPN